MNIGDKISFKLSNYELTSCWDTPFGIMYLYTFKDYFNRTFIWKTSRLIDNDISIVSGRVKGFLEYNDIQEIELSYCRVK